MKQALVDGQLTPATPDARPTATCPHCGGVVKLRSRQGTYFWRHVELPRAGCHPPKSESVRTGVKNHIHWVRRVGDLVVELSLGAPEGPHLRLRSLSGEAAGDPPELAINPEVVRLLATALLEAGEELSAAEAARHE